MPAAGSPVGRQKCVAHGEEKQAEMPCGHPGIGISHHVKEANQDECWNILKVIQVVPVNYIL